jgi:predicted  nucleic acid-binding Zn-ribbon protein
VREFTENVVKEQIDLLVRLQEKDMLVEKLEGQISDGPKRLKDLENQLQSLEESLEGHRNRIQELMKAQRQYEAEIEDGVAHMRKSRGRLMSIKNNKEYRALVREIEETEKDNAAK